MPSRGLAGGGGSCDFAQDDAKAAVRQTAWGLIGGGGSCDFAQDDAKAAVRQMAWGLIGGGGSCDFAQDDAKAVPRCRAVPDGTPGALRQPEIRQTSANVGE